MLLERHASLLRALTQLEGALQTLEELIDVLDTPTSEDGPAKEGEGTPQEEA